MSTKLKELRGKLDERRAKLHEVFKEAGEDMDMGAVTVLEGDSAAKVAQIRAMNDEVDDFAKQIEEFTGLEAIKKRGEDLGAIDRGVTHVTPGASRDRDEPQKSLGRLFVESEAFTGYKRGQNQGPTAELDLTMGQLRAATFLTSSGWAPESIRTGRVVEAALRPIQVMDLVSDAATTQAAVVYMEETTATSGAAERAENAAYAASTLILTQRSKTVRSIGTSLPVTDEQLEDVAQAESYVNGRLGFFVFQRLDGQLLNGDDMAPNIQGYLNATGLQTQAKGADPVPDAIYKAMTKIRVTGRAFPSAAVFHPNDWQDVRLLRTADGIYIWGSPADAGPERIWGLQVAQSDAIVENTALVGDFSPVMSQLYVRRGLEVQVGYDTGDFINGRQTVRAGLRAALVIYRGAAFCTCTGV